MSKHDLSPLFGACLVFDLDGTLVDTAPDIISSLNHCLMDDGLSALDGQTCRHLIGKGVRDLIMRAYSQSGKTPAEAAIFPLVERFMVHYRAHISDNSKPFERAETVLTELKNAGAVLSICTNKPHDLACLLIKNLGWDGYFSSLLGADAVDHKKPSAQHLWECVKRAKGNKDKTIMIGDSITDYETGRNANVPVILFSHGYSDLDLDSLNAEALIDHYDDLIPSLLRVITAEPLVMMKKDD
jgi:phosphoglycolate phosphatase